MQFMDEQRVHYAVQQLCQVLDVVPSRYYAWRQRQVAGAAENGEPAWETEMLAVFDHHERRYGTRRLQVELREKGSLQIKGYALKRRGQWVPIKADTLFTPAQ